MVYLAWIDGSLDYVEYGDVAALPRRCGHHDILSLCQPNILEQLHYVSTILLAVRGMNLVSVSMLAKLCINGRQVKQLMKSTMVASNKGTTVPCQYLLMTSKTVVFRTAEVATSDRMMGVYPVMRKWQRGVGIRDATKPIRSLFIYPKPERTK